METVGRFRAHYLVQALGQLGSFVLVFRSLTLIAPSFMIGRSCLGLLVIFTTTVGSDDHMRLGEVNARLPLPRHLESLLQRLQLKFLS